MFRIMQSAHESSAASRKCRFRVRYFGSVFDLPYKKLGAGHSYVPSQNAREPSVLRSYIGVMTVVTSSLRAIALLVVALFAIALLAIASLAICLLSLCSLLLCSHFAATLPDGVSGAC